MSLTVSMMLKRFVLLAAFALIASACNACPTAVPNGLRFEPVGEQLVVNGLPLTIRQVTAEQSRAEVLERVEQEWIEAKWDVRRSRSGDWDIVSARSASCLATLQLVDRKGAFGLFGVSRAPSRAESVAAARQSVRLPGGVVVDSSVASVDGSRRGTTIAFSSKRSADDIDAYFVTQLDKDGWQAVSSHQVRSGSSSGASNRARIVTAQKGREQVSIVLWEEGATRALLNVSEAL